MFNYEIENLSYQEITLRYAHMMVREIFKSIASNKITLLKCNKIIHSNFCDGTSRYWKSQAKGDHVIREIIGAYRQLAVLDNKTHWSDKLHQDRYSFVKKYPEILEEYRSSYKNKCTYN